jgi:hypothetical protein
MVSEHPMPNSTPPPTRWLPSVLVLLVGAGLGAMTERWWLMERAPSSAEVAGATATVEGEAGLVEAWLSPQEIAAKIERMPETELRAMLARADSALWSGHPNRREALRAALRRLAGTLPPADLAPEAVGWVKAWKVAGDTRRDLLRALGEIFAEMPAMTPSLLAAALRGMKVEEVQSALGGWLAVQAGVSPEADAALARHWMLEAGCSEDQKLTGIAQAVAVGAWMERQPEAAAAFAGKVDRTAIRHVLDPGLRQLNALRPEKATQVLRLAADAGLYPEACGESAFYARLTAAQLHTVIAGKPAARFARSASYFGFETQRIAPQELPALAAAFTAREVFANWEEGDRALYVGGFAIGAGLAGQSVDAGRAWLSTLPIESRAKFLEHCWSFYSVPTPGLARLYLDENPNPENSLGSSPFLVLGDRDFDEANRRLERASESTRKQAGFALWLSEIQKRCDGDIAATMKMAASAPELIRTNLTETAFRMFAPEDPSAARAWLAQSAKSEHPLGAEETLDLFTLKLSDAEREQRLTEALKFGEIRAGETPPAATAATLLLASYARNAPEKGVAWLAQLPAGATADGLVVNFTDEWSRIDPTAAGQWVEQLPAGARRDGAMIAMANTRKSNADDALHWASGIADPEKRWAVTTTLVASWAKADPQTAARLIANARVDDGERAKLQAILDGSPSAIRRRADVR